MNGAYHDKETRVKSDASLIINNSTNRVKEKEGRGKNFGRRQPLQSNLSISLQTKTLPDPIDQFKLREDSSSPIPIHSST